MMETQDTKRNHRSRSKSIRGAIFWGIISLAMYLLFFLNQEAITQYFTKGGASTIVLIVTALAFSFVHGSFASYILELVGIRPLQEKDR